MSQLPDVVSPPSTSPLARLREMASNLSEEQTLNLPAPVQKALLEAQATADADAEIEWQDFSSHRKS